jgi:hypothetical protein
MTQIKTCLKCNRKRLESQNVPNTTHSSVTEATDSFTRSRVLSVLCVQCVASRRMSFLNRNVASTVTISVFREVTPCSLVQIHRGFWPICCLSVQGVREGSQTPDFRPTILLCHCFSAIRFVARFQSNKVLKKCLDKCGTDRVILACYT